MNTACWYNLYTVCWSTFWKSSLKLKLICKFDMRENAFLLFFYSVYLYVFTYILISCNRIILRFNLPNFHTSNSVVFYQVLLSFPFPSPDAFLYDSTMVASLVLRWSYDGPSALEFMRHNGLNKQKESANCAHIITVTSHTCHHGFLKSPAHQLFVQHFVQAIIKK